jgi:hypothetical protein
VLGDLLDDDPTRSAMQHAAVRQAAAFGWDATVDATLDVYRAARRAHRARWRVPSPTSPTSLGALAVAPRGVR